MFTGVILCVMLGSGSTRTVLVEAEQFAELRGVRIVQESASLRHLLEFTL